ncbi:hypothetical protein EZV62_002938 [Acer yangbiense]|uniref:Uncharacterized protein n=1 Tax=Acer yangbiense TaxID=1000413 RepID=A0A5C7IYY9_9ROSI|nr:hypothetical protein EZV62_002938 [Acer yangbiense]
MIEIEDPSGSPLPMSDVARTISGDGALLGGDMEGWFWISIAILLIKLPFGGGDHGINTKSPTANSQSRIRFIDIPEADPPTQLLMTSPTSEEQKFNAFMMVKELGLAAAIESGSGKDNGRLVAAEEIARAVRHLMDGDNEIKKKAMEMAEISKKSLMEGGSSFVSLGKFIDLNF